MYHFDWFFWVVFCVTLMVVFVIVAPIQTLLHEIGHAIVARWFTHQAVDVYLGYIPGKKGSQPKDHLCWKLAGITFHVRLWPLPGFVGYAQYKGYLPLTKQIGIFLAGPLVSLILLLMGGWLSFYLAIIPVSYWWYDLALFSTIMVLITLTGTIIPSPPVRRGPYAGMNNDGTKALLAWRQLRNK